MKHYNTYWMIPELIQAISNENGLPLDVFLVNFVYMGENII